RHSGPDRASRAAARPRHERGARRARLHAGGGRGGGARRRLGTIHEGRQEGFGRGGGGFGGGGGVRDSPGRTITEAEDHLFCMLTMAASPLHVDAHYAERELAGGRNLVVGTFVYAALLGMSVPDTSGKAIAALGTESLRHVAPLHHGDTLYGE